MSDSSPNQVSSRFYTEFPARWGFWKGLGLGVIIEVPAISGSLWLFLRWEHQPAVTFATLLRFTALFCGVAAVVTAGGIGRLAAHASHSGPAADRAVPINAGRVRARAATIAARAHAVASLGLVFIAALPHRHLPEHAAGWAMLLGCGAAAGALSGAVIGLVCSGPAPVNLADVVALARKPGHALHDLLDPEDLRHLGAALRDRTGHLLTGMFEPAQPPPQDTSPPPPAASKPTPDGIPEKKEEP